MITYREVTNTLLIASMLAAILSLIIAGLWYALPKPPVLIVGTLADFPAANDPIPYYVSADDHQLFVVNTGNEIIVLDARATTQRAWQGIRHPVRWVSHNQRFEDPLSASKYSVTGEWLEGPADRDLDRYVYEIIDGKLHIHLWQVVEGAPSAWPPHIRRPGLYNGGFCVDQGFTRSCAFP
jgi:hypothetical protein